MGALSSLTPTPAWFRMDDASAVGTVRRYTVELARAVGLGEQRIADIAIVVAELATNLIKHADEGSLLVRPVRQAENVGVEIVSIDSAPGMVDLSAMYEDGHSTTGTLGIGLGAVARLADRCEGFSLPGRGSVLAARLWQAAEPPPAWADGLTRPLTGETVSGDCFAVRDHTTHRQVMVCDGLGHGPAAAAAAQAAFNIFHTAPDEAPATLVERLHRGLSHTRGAAVTIAEIDPAAGVVRACGVGNVATAVVTGGERRGMVSMPGIVGHGKASFRQFVQPFTAQSLLVMHSDGVSDKWSLTGYPGLDTRSPLLIAATVLRDAGVRRDDACVLVARATP
ncbi:ATP-binding protein [Catellatospora bangladeshensis]|uniref:Transcriptional regulator n=1 Tax=Catellatospora bangladeshensis TaxID=310355 RepID=A0A8J3JM03_9ACTN|nr:ATP-binding SpoIIE family protein phosphatase [Catellatospora bangladeshensis]GIF80389.1 transcriptional regulator [Catellatospora bangladeshensis]